MQILCFHHSFCSTLGYVSGPKAYGYMVVTPDGKKHYKTKVRGFSLNYENSELLNYDTMVEMVKNYVEGDGADRKTLKFKQIERRNDLFVTLKIPTIQIV